MCTYHLSRYRARRDQERASCIRDILHMPPRARPPPSSFFDEAHPGGQE